MQDYPNILLLIMDAARADHLSCYGYNRPTTPNIDRIAREGTLYENAITPGVWTVPSHASFFTGLYPSGHRLSGRNLKLANDRPTLATYLTDKGYRTVGMSANSLVGHMTGLARGFQTYKELHNIIQTQKPNLLQKVINHLYRLIYWKKYDDGALRISYELKHQIKKTTQDLTKQPFFIFVNYLEPHLFYHPPKFFRNKFLTPAQQSVWRKVNQNPRLYMSGNVQMDMADWEILTGLYDAELAYLDMRIGQVYDMLQESGILDNTLVIVTADHGENIGHHNLMDHQYCVYDSLLKIPMIIRYPKAFPQNHRVTEQVQTIDIFKTIGEMLDSETFTESYNLPGKNLLPHKIKQDPYPFTLAEYLTPQLHSFKRESLNFDERFHRTYRTIREMTYKYIWASDGTEELYDIANDPDEIENLIEQQPQEAKRLRGLLDLWVQKLETYDVAEDVDLDSELLERLEDLGYI